MLTPDHPNAKWLADFYRGAADVENDPLLDEDARERAVNELTQRALSKISPDFRIHTGGNRLGTTGDLAFTLAYMARRKALTGGTFRPIAIDQILADDEYGVIHGTFGAEQNGKAFKLVGMGVWRFDESGRAVEHWEIGPGHEWDRLFLAGDPDLGDGSATEFWTKD